MRSILVYNQTIRPEKFKVILNCHLDVIPGKDFQYFPKIKDDKLFGVGSMDMKSNVACLIHTFKKMVSKVNYPLALQIVTDEEFGGFNVTKYQVDQGVKADFVIAGEATDFNIVNKAKGVLWLKISCKGKTAHGAYPWKGENAVWKMFDFLILLRQKYPVFTEQKWATSINFASIETTNKSFNKILDDCSICLDIRLIPEDQTNFLLELKQIIPDDFQIDILEDEAALFTCETNTYLKAIQKATKEIINTEPILYGAQGTSDARHFTVVGIPGVEFGPIGGGIGTDQEWVSISSLETYCFILEKFLLDI